MRQNLCHFSATGHHAARAQLNFLQQCHLSSYCLESGLENEQRLTVIFKTALKCPLVQFWLLYVSSAWNSNGHLNLLHLNVFS